MLLAAGRGARLRPLTDQTPKPLLKVAGRALIEWQIDRLAAAGFAHIVINHAWLGAQIEGALGDGTRYGVHIAYSAEGEALETVGGIVRALPLLGKAPVVVASADLYTDYPYARLQPIIARIEAEYPDTVAHFVLVDNPPYHRHGDFGLTASGRATRTGERLNYAGIAVYHPAIFAGLEASRPARLFPWANRFVDAGQVSAEHYRGVWHNIGTTDDLAAVRADFGEPVPS
jgi:MurNAc alpha-1-phosphate uridylyltransferase